MVGIINKSFKLNFNNNMNEQRIENIKLSDRKSLTLKIREYAS